MCVKTRIQGKKAEENIINTQTLPWALWTEPPGFVATSNTRILAIRERQKFLYESIGLLCKMTVAIVIITIGCVAGSQGIWRTG